MNTKVQVMGHGLWVMNKKLKKFFVFLFLLTSHLSLFMIFTGCQQMAAQVKPDDAAPQQDVQQKQGVVIMKIAFDKSDNAAKVLVEGTGNIAYTTFKLSDPFRLVIDIPDADMDKVKESMLVENEVISQITTAQYGKEQAGTKIGRIVIGLKSDADYKVDVQEGKLLVRLNAAAPQEVKAQEKKAEPVKEEIKESITAAQTAKEAKSVPEGLNRGKAERITAIETIKKEKDLTTIMVLADGNIGSYNAFGLDDPSRLVVDIWGVGTNIADKNKVVNIGGSHIKKVRLGEHKDKIRLVFESIPKNLPLYSVDVTGAAMTISYGRVEVKKFIPAGSKQGTEPQVAAVPKPETSENKVSNIDFKPSQVGAKLTITTSKKADYKLSKSIDGKSIVIDFKNVNMPDELKKTIDAATLDTPVASVSSFQMSGESAKGARVLVKLKENAVYDVVQDSNNIYLTFPMQVKATQQMKEASQQKAAEPAQAPAQSVVQKQEKIEEVKPVASIAAGGNAKIEANAAPSFSEEKVEKKVELQAGTVASVSGETPIDCKAEMPATYLCKKLSLDFKDADIGNLLRLMAEVSNLNIISDEGVAGKVTLRLVDVPWHQAFDIILKSKGLGKTQDGNVVRIMPLTKIKQEEDAVVAAKKAKEKLEDLVSEKVAVNYAKAKDMEEKVKSVLSSREGASVISDERTNTIIIRDIPVNAKSAVELVKSLDTQTPQVIIEVRIVEASSSFARELGVQWGMDVSNVGKDQRYGIGGATGTSGLSALGGTIGQTTQTESGIATSTGVRNFAVNLPIASSPTGAIGFTFGKLLGDPFTLDLKLSAAESAGVSKTISRPKIATMDNKVATISQGKKIPYQTTSSSGTETKFIDATLKLKVVPHIIPDGTILMKVDVTKNSQGDLTPAGYVILEKAASTEILLRDMETVVIGGIIETVESDSTSGVPWLKDLPGIGWLFKKKFKSDNQTELLIFITPAIQKEKL